MKSLTPGIVDCEITREFGLFSTGGRILLFSGSCSVPGVSCRNKRHTCPGERILKVRSANLYIHVLFSFLLNDKKEYWLFLINEQAISKIYLAIPWSKENAFVLTISNFQHKQARHCCALAQCCSVSFLWSWNNTKVVTGAPLHLNQSNWGGTSILPLPFHKKPNFWPPWKHSALRYWA